MHLVHMSTNALPEQEAKSTISQNEDNDHSTYFSTLLVSDATDSIKMRRKIQQKIDELQIAVDKCDQVEALHVAYKHVNAAAIMLFAVSKTKSTTQTNLLRKCAYAPNVKSQSQPKFFSTKKKRLTTSTILSKPTPQQLSQSQATLKGQEPSYCAVCFKKNDKNNTEDVSWVQCSSCTMWIHQCCTSLCDESEQTVDFDQIEFVCHYCNPSK